MAGEEIWPVIRNRFLAGEKPAKIAADYGLTAKQVSQRAYREGWKAEREKVSEIVAEQTTEAVAARLVKEAADYVAQHTKDWQTIRDAIMQAIETELDPSDKAKIAVAVSQAMERVQKGQRLSLGLDRKDDDKPVESKPAVMVVPPDSDDWQSLAVHDDSADG